MTQVCPCLSLFSILVLIASQERLRGLSSIEWQDVDVRWRAGADAGEQSAQVALFLCKVSLLPSHLHLLTKGSAGKHMGGI